MTHIIETYHFTDEKSTKFWEISYNSEGGQFTTKYGKVGLKGRECIQTGTIQKIRKIIESKITKGYILQSTESPTNPLSTIVTTSRRAPISHHSSWENKQDDSPVERASKAKINQMNDLQDYDIIINEKESGYRNCGVYIYKDNQIFELSDYPDDYGSLPEWVEIRKEDCGHSYFSDYLIDHNSFVPFKTSDWEIKQSYIEDEVKPFKFAYCNLVVTTELYRPKDEAKAMVSSSIKISAPWLGGPTDNVKPTTGGSNGKISYHNYVYENGDQLTIEYVYDQNYEYQLLPDIGQDESEITIPPDIITQAINIVNEQFQDYFKSREVVYFESESPGCLTTSLPTKWNNEDNFIVEKIIVLNSR